jgi:hypothetical protein
LFEMWAPLDKPLELFRKLGKEDFKKQDMPTMRPVGLETFQLVRMHHPPRDKPLEKNDICLENKMHCASKS